MNVIKTISLLTCNTIFLSACNFTILPLVPDDNSYLRDKSGNIVRDCDGQALFEKWPDTESFWRVYNLPKGTTEFVCVDGKAYLKGKEPNK